MRYQAGGVGGDAVKESAAMDKKKKRGFALPKVIAAVIAVCAVGVYFFTENAQESEITAIPVFNDMTEENRTAIENVYSSGMMMPSGGGSFGYDDVMTTSEAAFVALRLYETRNGLPLTYSTYYVLPDEYINKAMEYGIWPQLPTTGLEPLTREGAAAVLAQFVDASIPVIGSMEDFSGSGEYAYRAEELYLYNRGIALSQNIKEAYSPYTAITRGEMAELITMLSDPALRLTELMPDFGELERTLTEMMSGYDGDWSLYFSDIDTGNVISINNHQVYSASLVKLFVIQTVYQRIASGQMSDSAELEELLRRMITYSDNEAWMTLTRRIGGTHMAGMRIVTQTAAAAGFTSSGQFMQGNRANYNFTSVEDCGHYMEKLLSGEIVSPEYSEKILELLKRQQIVHKIPAGVEPGVEIANKTGELEYVEGDAAIVYAPSGTYVLVIIADDLIYTGRAEIQITELSSVVYNFLNPYTG